MELFVQFSKYVVAELKIKSSFMMMRTEVTRKNFNSFQDYCFQEKKIDSTSFKFT